jgi:hypothetical protein
LGETHIELRIEQVVEGHSISVYSVAMRLARTKQMKKGREAERDYSHRLLIDKLGGKSGQRVAVLGVEGAEFLADLAARVPGYSRGEKIVDADLVFFSAEAAKDLSKLKGLRRTIQKNGAIWVVYPKGQTHIRETDVIAAGKSVGLVDNKVCKFSETHTALRFVIPVAQRGE